MLVEKIVVGSIQTNCYIVGCEDTKEAIIIDPGDDYDAIKKALLRHQVIPKCVVDTHGHIDHICANDKFGVPVYIHKADADFLTDPMKNLSFFMGKPEKFKKADFLLNDADVIKFGLLKLKVMHTPGHTPGGISLLIDGVLFTGDTLFCGGVGRTDFPYASEDDLMDSIHKKLFTFDNKTKIYPGHGLSSTIAAEKGNF